MKLVCFGLLFVFCQPVDEPAPTQVTVTVCPIAAPWTADYQKRLAAELRVLPPGSAIESAVPRRSVCAIRHARARSRISDVWSRA